MLRKALWSYVPTWQAGPSGKRDLLHWLTTNASPPEGSQAQDFVPSPTPIQCCSRSFIFYLWIKNSESLEIFVNAANRTTRTFLTHLPHFLVRTGSLVLPKMLSCPVFCQSASWASAESSLLCTVVMLHISELLLSSQSNFWTPFLLECFPAWGLSRIEQLLPPFTDAENVLSQPPEQLGCGQVTEVPSIMCTCSGPGPEN